MDAIVEAALRKWPNVPHCHGWLALDARGDWYMRDLPTQAAGAFPHVKGSRIEHAALIAFIGRNYARDENGAWFFQNGPQRVYVELEVAPWVWRLQAVDGGLVVCSHTGIATAPTSPSAWLDEAGRVFLETRLGLGLVHTMDVDQAADAVTAGWWSVRETTHAELLRRSADVLRPAPRSVP